ncbi:hypothetical protein HK096_007836, partial [Nowakowskiella sp. JEL0078]
GKLFGPRGYGFGGGAIFLSSNEAVNKTNNNDYQHSNISPNSTHVLSNLKPTEARLLIKQPAGDNDKCPKCVKSVFWVQEDRSITSSVFNVAKSAVARCWTQQISLRKTP